jgi:hypothetical protein
MANKHRKVWKVVSQKVNSEKQTWPWYLYFLIKYIFYIIYDID